MCKLGHVGWVELSVTHQHHGIYVWAMDGLTMGCTHPTDKTTKTMGFTHPTYKLAMGCTHPTDKTTKTMGCTHPTG